MKTTALFFLSMLLIGASVANDSVYHGSGGALYPIKETRIEMKREFLSFTCREGYAEVNVLFEFFNPDDVERKLTVGFQSPSAYLPSDDEVEMSAPPIYDLQIMNDGRLLPYRIMMAEDDESSLVDLGKLTFNMENSGLFVYLFEMTFKPGTNVVQHAYRFRAGGSVMGEQYFPYILKTGAKWAGGKITDFTFELDLDRHSRFAVSDVFGANANWSVVGLGRIGEPHGLSIHGPGERVVSILQGKLVVTARDLGPTDNINVTGVPGHVYLGLGDDISVYGEEIVHAWRWRTMEGISEEPLSKEDLRLLRNMVFAQHGYVFMDPLVQKTFERFDWYLPDPNLKWENNMLSPEDVLFVELIKLKETD
jgi:hypothetical protein